MKNPWLREYKQAKDILLKSRVILFSGNCRGVFGSKPIAPVVTYTMEDDFPKMDFVTISGFIIYDEHNLKIYEQTFISDVRLLKGDSVTLDLGKLKVGHRWELQDLIPEDHI